MAQQSRYTKSGLDRKTIKNVFKVETSFMPPGHLMRFVMWFKPIRAIIATGMRT